MDDLRDQPLGGALDRWASTIEPDLGSALPSIYRHARRQRAVRLIAAIGAVAVFVAAVAWGAIQMRAGDGSTWITVGSMQDDGWTMSIPRSWETTAIAACEDMPLGDGVIATSVPFELRNPQGGSPSCMDRFIWAGFPANGVAIGVEPMGRITGAFPRSTTVLPLTSASLERPDAIRGGPAMRYTAIIDQSGGPIALVRTWTGPQASASDRAALERALRSIRFDALQGSTSPAALARALEIHRLLETALQQLWTIRSNIAETTGEIGAARSELARLSSRPPTAERLRRIQHLRDRVTAWTERTRQRRAQAEQLAGRIQQIRATRDRVVAAVSSADAPTTVDVRCDADAQGGTSVSTPIVRRVDGSVAFRVTGWDMGGETASLYATPGGRIGRVPPGTNVALTWRDAPTGTVELVCTYGRPPYAWPHPGHPLTIVAAP